MLNKSSAKKKIDLVFIHEICELLIDSKNIRESVAQVIKILSEYFGFLKCVLTIVNKHNGRIFIEEAYGLTPDEMKRGVYKIGEGITGKVVKTGAMILLKNIADEPQFLDKTRSRSDTDKEKTAFLCMPIKHNLEVIGTLSVDLDNNNENALEYTVIFLKIITSVISQSVRVYQLRYEENELLKEENERLTDMLKEQFHPKNIIGKSGPMQQLYNMIFKVAESRTTVLILGESGVGKELVANAIHFGSERSTRPFIKFNCAALPPSLVESELFGHEKGAFTGANALRTGKFEAADTGTIFLDEIGELEPTIQSKLLRVIQEKEIDRIGGDKPVRVDIRIISATNKNLEELAKSGRFREDLFYRLNVFPLFVPPLRERKTDIMLLADHFIEIFNSANKKNIRRISTPAINMMMSYHWPGNVRELENCIERAVLLSEDDVIHGYHLPPSLQSAQYTSTGDTGELGKKLDTIEYEMIIEALKQSGGCEYKAASQLGLTTRQLGLRLKKFSITLGDYKFSRRYRNSDMHSKA